MDIFTIGFTQSSAERFFGRLKKAGLRQLMDIRLNNRSQLAGFAKQQDLKFFLSEICNIQYRYEPLLAPTQEILDAYKKNGGQWSVYEQQFLELMRKREIETQFSPGDFDPPAVLLCSEATAQHCHRRLVVDYLQQHWPEVNAIHL